MTATGRRMPVDAEPAPLRGNVWVVGHAADGTPKVEVRSGPSLLTGTSSGPYLSHFATCPNAADHRR